MLMDATMATCPGWAPGVLCARPVRNLRSRCRGCQCMDVASDVAHSVDGSWPMSRSPPSGLGHDLRKAARIFDRLCSRLWAQHARPWRQQNAPQEGP